MKLSKKTAKQVQTALKTIRTEQKKNAFLKEMKAKVTNYFVAHFQRLKPDDFILGQGPHNHQCYYNAVQHTVDNSKTTVHLVFCVETQSQECFMHVINKMEDGKYQDNSLGYFWKNHEYYYIKECLPDSYPGVWDWFEGNRKRFLRILGAEKYMLKYDLRSSEVL